MQQFKIKILNEELKSIYIFQISCIFQRISLQIYNLADNLDDGNTLVSETAKLQRYLNGALPFLRNVNIIISTVDSRRARLVYFSSLPTVRNGRGFNRASTGLSPQPLSSVRGKRFFPQFPRDCLLRKFSTPIDCPLLGQIIFIIFLGARPLAMRATLWPPRNEAAQPFTQPLHLLAVNFYQASE